MHIPDLKLIRFFYSPGDSGGIWGLQEGGEAGTILEIMVRVCAAEQGMSSECMYSVTELNLDCKKVKTQCKIYIKTECSDLQIL